MKGLGPLERAGLAAVGIVLCCMVLTMARVPMASVDGRTLWGLHARLIHDTGRYPAPELLDPAFRIPHPQYPPLLPLLQAGALALLPGEPALRALPWLFYLAIFGVLLHELPRRDPQRGRLLALAYALLPTLVLSEEGGADAGVADTVLAAFVLGTALALDAGRPALAGILAAASALTKNEGLVLGPLLLATGYWRCGDGKRAGAVLRAVAVFAALVMPWLLLRQVIPAGFDELYASRLTPEQVMSGASRAPALALEMARVTFLHPQRSGLFWWMVVFLAALAPSVRRLWLDGRLVTLPAFFAFVLLLYVVSPAPGVSQVQLSFERLLLQVAPLALLALATAAHSTGTHIE